VLLLLLDVGVVEACVTVAVDLEEVVFVYFSVTEVLSQGGIVFVFEEADAVAVVV